LRPYQARKALKRDEGEPGKNQQCQSKAKKMKSMLLLTAFGRFAAACQTLENLAR
jgi:hypothetical protein